MNELIPYFSPLRPLALWGATKLLPRFIPGVAAFVPHALPLATKLLPLTGLLKEYVYHIWGLFVITANC